MYICTLVTVVMKIMLHLVQINALKLECKETVIFFLKVAQITLTVSEAYFRVKKKTA